MLRQCFLIENIYPTPTIGRGDCDDGSVGTIQLIKGRSNRNQDMTLCAQPRLAERFYVSRWHLFREETYKIWKESVTIISEVPVVEA